MYKEPSSSTKSSLIEYCTKLMPNKASPTNDPRIVDTNMSATNCSSNLLPDKAIQFYTSLLEVNMNDRMTKITQDAAHKNTSNEFENYGFFEFIIDIKLKLNHIKKAFCDQFSHGFEEPDATRQFTETERRSNFVLINKTKKNNKVTALERLKESIHANLKVIAMDHRRSTFELIMAGVSRGIARWTNRIHYYGNKIIQGSLVVMESAADFMWDTTAQKSQ